ncbi:putative MFS family arabinose efflux permease [Pseudarthrobacter sp. W1I19]|nr:putative MFS family arabinose efflux permease [Pseudarthrobacter sp. W1I19]
MAAASFITVLTEALPGGILPEMSGDLQVTESVMGQSVTIYAIGSAVAAVPLSAATSAWRRKRLLLAAMAGFIVANTITALSDEYALTMASRFIAGVSGGLVWAMMANYARRMVPSAQHGKAIAVAMAGTPLALALGVPAGTAFGQALGWRISFLAMTAFALVVLAWLSFTVPDFPGQPRQHRVSVAQTMRVPGVTPVLFVVLTVVLAHTILYTYISPFLAQFGMSDSVAVVLFVFGTSSVVSIFFVGTYIHHRLRTLTIVGTVLFALAAIFMATLGGESCNRLPRSGDVGDRFWRHGHPIADRLGRCGRWRGRHRTSSAGHAMEHGPRAGWCRRRPSPSGARRWVLPLVCTRPSYSSQRDSHGGPRQRLPLKTQAGWRVKTSRWNLASPGH